VSEKQIVHVYPTDDIMEHEVDGEPCACCPRVEAVGDGIVVMHDALDGRE
jgi:hypothetical protein